MTRAFSLIELLVVTAVIGVLASGAVAYTGSTRRTARDANRKETVAQLSASIDQYFSAVRPNTYFLRNVGASACTASAGTGGFMAGTGSGCAGFQGGGAGRIHAAYPPYVSVANALINGGFLARAVLDPQTRTFEAAGSGKDYLLVTCDNAGNPATTGDDAQQYAVLAQLEAPSAADLDSAAEHCGKSGFTLTAP